MAEHITATAEAIASALGTLPGIKEVFPYPKPMSQTQIGMVTMTHAYWWVASLRQAQGERYRRCNGK